jgi:hypothetical protein
MRVRSCLADEALASKKQTAASDAVMALFVDGMRQRTGD